MGWTFWLSLIAGLTQGASFLWGRLLPPNQTALMIAAVIGGVAAFAITVLQGLAVTDSAYMVEAHKFSNGVMFFFNATADLQTVSFDGYNANDPRQYLFPYQEIHIRSGINSVPNYLVPVGDWKFDIDALGYYGKVLQEIVIEQSDGKPPMVTFTSVHRKNLTGDLICRYPPIKLVPVCVMSVY